MTDYLPRVTSRWANDIEGDACEFLRRHFPACLSKPTKLDVLEAWELLDDYYGLMPEVAELSDGVEGMAWADGRVQVSENTYRQAVAGKGRARFTMCHEAYHALKHRSEIQNVLIDAGEPVLYRRSKLPKNRNPEWQADKFAAFVLMPTVPMLQVLAESGSRKIEDVVYYFGVTPTAAKIRIASLRNKTQYEPPYILSDLGDRMSQPNLYQFDYQD